MDGSPVNAVTLNFPNQLNLDATGLGRGIYFLSIVM